MNIRANTELVRDILAGRCAKCVDENLCIVCDEVSDRLAQTKRICPYESIVVAPPTIYALLVEEKVVAYYMLITVLRFMLDACKMACDPAFETVGETTAEYLVWVEVAKKIAAPHIERDGEIITEADAAYDTDPNLLTYLNRLEARVCFIQAVMKVSAEEASICKDGVASRIDTEARKIFDLCASIEVQPAPKPISQYQKIGIDTVIEENAQWNVNYRIGKLRQELLDQVKLTTKQG